MTSELRERLFAEVEQKLLEFKKTPAYRDMLFRQVKEALDFAAGDEMTVYLDPSDTHLANAITEEINITGFAPPLSQKESFQGNACRHPFQKHPDRQFFYNIDE